ncbi:MAG: DUF1684 domain-containing protein [Dehalococcoidia bacterium]|nr:DUF1684 domain-containing protein [Dehalococcoidia bacterium]
MPELTEFREAKDHYFAHDVDSPLTAAQQRGFTGLTYYEEAPALAFAVTPNEYDDPDRVEMVTSTGETASYERWARLTFEVGGAQAALTVYRAPDGDLFLPFRDATSGEETYGAGRYLEVEDLGDGRLLLDFNYAYNPFCAYNEAFSCPIPPPENRLAVAIRAGERGFASDN